LATNYEEDDRQTAIQTMSSGRDVNVRGSRGTIDTQARWELLQGAFARALLSDPDSIFYLSYLGSNRSRALVLQLHGLLGTAILAAEGLRYVGGTESSVSAGAVQAAVANISASIGRYAAPDSAAIRRLVAASDRYTRDSLLPNIRQGSRLQTKGEEAASAYRSSIEELLASWDAMLRGLTRLRLSSFFTVQRAQAVALRDPVQNLDAALSIGWDPADLSNFTLVLLAGVSSVEALSREVDPFIRMSTGLKPFPAGITSSIDGFSASFSVAGSVLDPRRLSIVEGDAVHSTFGVGTVTSVSSTAVTADVKLSPTMTVLSQAGVQYASMRKSLTPLWRALPSLDSLTQSLQRLDQTSAAALKERLQFLGNLMASLGELSSDVTSALYRVGVVADAPSLTIEAALLSYSPEVSLTTETSILGALDRMRDEGFSRAESLAIEGFLGEVLDMEVDDASYASSLSRATAEFSAGTGKLSSLQPFYRRR